jgi:hypothetical protein
MKVVAKSEQLNQVAYLQSEIDNPTIGLVQMVIVGEEGLDTLPDDVGPIPLHALIAHPYGDWEEIDANNS